MSDDTNIIQRARDVLAKWREGQSDLDGMPINYLVPEGDLAMIVGTAGNPDLLDAIDAVLAAAQVPPVPITVPVILLAQSIAAAIIAADERMAG